MIESGNSASSVSKVARCSFERPRPRRTNVAPPLTSFVGRARELEAIRAALFADARLVTLTGTGGIGKTRLAVEYALWAEREALADGQDDDERDDGTARLGGVWFCDLTEARTVHDIVGSVAHVLDISLAEGRVDPVERLGAALASRGPVLLILDNFEQVVEHAPASLGRWLVSAPEARFLVTSRERLRIPGERVLAISPLGVPALDTQGDEASAAEAFELFVRRARLVEPAFAVAPEAVPIVGEIVRQLDGIPLAIELAATRMGIMSPADVLERLQRRFDLLCGGPRAAVHRHQALRGAIDWSWQLLSPWERDALVQCAVFRGGFTLHAAEHVLDLGEHTETPPVLDVLQALHDKSLLHAQAPAEGAGCRRMSMYVSIAEYAAGKLAGAPFEAAVRERHQRYYLALGSTWAEETHGRVGVAFLERIAVEQENLIAAFWSAMRGAGADDAERALRTVLTLEPLLVSRGPLATLLALIDAACARMHDAGCDVRIRARAFECRGRARRLRASWAESLDDLQASQADARAAGERRIEGRALLEMGILHRQVGRMAEARACLDEALEVCRLEGDGRTEGIALGELGIVHKEQGQLARARTLYEQALQALRVAGDRRSEGRFCGDLGALHQEEGRFVEARAYFEEALTIHREVAHRRFEGIAQSDLGALHFEEARLELAEAAYRQAVTILGEVGDLRYEALFLGCLAAVVAGRGDIAAARELFHRSERTLETSGEALYLGAVAVHRGHLDLALATAADDTRAAQAHREQAKARLHVARQSPAGETASLAELSDDVRFAVRALTRALEDETAPPQGRATRLPAQKPAAGLVIAADASWFHVDGGTVVPLAHRANMHRMLAALLDARLRSPGQPLDVHALFQAGWPGVKADERAAANRVHVGLATLRKMGLAAVLVRSIGGYLMDETVALRVAESNEPA